MEQITLSKDCKCSCPSLRSKKKKAYGLPLFSRVWITEELYTKSQSVWTFMKNIHMVSTYHRTVLPLPAEIRIINQGLEQAFVIHLFQPAKGTSLALSSI